MSQIPLSDSDGRSIVPEHKARCPRCHKRGGVQVKPRGSIRTPTGRHRQRICTLCHYEFETEMSLPLACVKCSTIDDYNCIKTQNSRSGIHRIYRCNICGMNHPTFEAFPVPSDQIRRVTL